MQSRRALLRSVLALLLCAMTACSSERWTLEPGSSPPRHDPEPAATIARLEPAAAESREDQPLAVWIDGGPFVDTVTALWNGVAVPITSWSPGRLGVLVPATLLGRAGVVPVQVRQGEHVSPPVPFEVSDPVPAIAGVEAVTGPRGTELVVGGQDLRRDSWVELDGVRLTTAFQDPTRVIGTADPRSVVTSRACEVAVASPTPGGGHSGVLPCRREGVWYRDGNGSTAMAWDRVRNVLYVSELGGRVRRLDGATGRPLPDVPGAHGGGALALSADGRSLWVSSSWAVVRGAEVQRVDLDAGRVVATLPARERESAVASLAASPAGDVLAATTVLDGGGTCRLVVWQADRELGWRDLERCDDVTFDSTGRWLYGFEGSFDGIAVHELGPGGPEPRGTRPRPTGLSGATERAGGRFYFESGHVLDQQTLAVLWSYPVEGALTLDVPNGLAIFTDRSHLPLTGARVVAFDLAGPRERGQTALPAGGSAYAISRFGHAALVLSTSSELIFVKAPGL